MYGSRTGDIVRGDSQIQAKPTNFIRNGNYSYSTGNTDFKEDRGLYWHSAIYSSSYGVNLIFYPSYMLIQNAGYKGYGFSLRCLVRWFFAGNSLPTMVLKAIRTYWLRYMG